MTHAKDWLENIKTRWQAADHDKVHVTARMLVATAIAAGLLLPWLPVGPTGSMSGSKLLTYGITSPELNQWLAANPLGTILFVAFGAAMTAVTLNMAWRIVQGRTANGHLAFIIAAPPVVMLLAQEPIFERSLKTIGILPIPMWGLGLMMLASAMLLGHGLWLNRQFQRNQQAGAEV